MDIESLQNLHINRLCFIVGSGPSLHFQDISPLRDYVTIAVNSALVKCWEWCDFFVSDDWEIKNWNYFQQILPKAKCIKLFYKDKLREYCKHDDRTIFFNHKKFNDITLTREASLPIIGARTSMATAVHFAYIMGCDPIVLIGSDCCYRDEKRYFWQYPNEPTVCRITKNISPKLPTRLINGAKADSHCAEFLDYWKKLAKSASEAHCNIINASGGILESFPRMTLEKVLETYGDRKQKGISSCNSPCEFSGSPR